MTIAPPHVVHRSQPARGKIRLLLVDDNPDNLISLEAMLHGLTDEVVLARSGAEALRHILENQDFAAILLDVKMPDMDGFETAELIRTRRGNRNTPILFLTGFRNDEQLFRGYDLGAVDFLFKPVVPEILRSKVTVFVELARNNQLLRSQAETLAKAELKFRSLLEATPDAMLITQADGVIVLVNAHMHELFGYERGEILGQNLRVLVPGWSFPPLPRTGAGTAGHVSEPQDLCGIRKDGSKFPVEMSLSPLQTEEGLLITSVIRDISERRKAEESIRLLNAELEARVASRTAELSRSNDALRQFAWAASHDLQEPLRMVVAYSQWLDKSYGQSLEGPARQFLEYIVTGAMRMNNLLAALRDYMQVTDAGNQELTLVDAGKCLDRALSNLQAAIDSSSATITAGLLPSVMSVPVLLVQVFQNLISNAIKYSGNGTPPRIHVSALCQGSECVLSVQDNGIGIAPEYHDRVFGVFKRLHSDGTGTGIGLAICKASVEHWGGRIWVESALGAGATFRFTAACAKEMA
ncbi:MAG: response regulator [Acidobacteriia bacterium]|nr:response regulator [Terriglobia bacterium]